MSDIDGDYGAGYIKKGIQMTIDTLWEFGHGDAEIKTAIMKKYDISAEEVDGYF